MTPSVSTYGIDPINESTGGGALVAATAHVPDQVIIHIQAQGRRGQPNVMADGEGRVLIGGPAANAPVLRGSDSAVSLRAKHDFRGVQQIGLFRNHRRALI